MYKYLLTLLMAATAFNAAASCKSVLSQITQKIIHNGVAEDSFRLKVEPASQASKQEDKIIGNCDNGKSIIIYQKINEHANTKTTQ